MELPDQPTLWGNGTTRTFRPIWVAEEIGLDYTLVPMGPRTGETRTPEFTAWNPRQKIPFYADRFIALSESVAICRYMMEQYDRQGVLYRPRSVTERARHDEWCCYLLAEVDETSLYVMRRHRDLPEIYGEAPAALHASAEYLDRQLRVVAAHLMDHDFVMGAGFGLPDILLVSCLDWALHYELPLPPPLEDYRARLHERPACQRARRINYGDKAPGAASGGGRGGASGGGRGSG